MKDTCTYFVIGDEDKSEQEVIINACFVYNKDTIDILSVQHI